MFKGRVNPGEENAMLQFKTQLLTWLWRFTYTAE